MEYPLRLMEGLEGLQEPWLIPPDMEGEFLALFKEQGDKVTQLILSYGETHGMKPRVLLNTLRIQCSNVPRWEFYKHLQVCVEVPNVPYKDKQTWLYCSVRYDPYKGKGLAPSGAGYSEPEAFSLFCRLGLEFTGLHITKQIFYSLEEGVEAYWNFSKRYKKAGTPMLYNRNRGKNRFLISREGGCPLFTSYQDIWGFFYGDGTGLHIPIRELIERRYEGLVARVQALPNGGRYVP